MVPLLHRSKGDPVPLLGLRGGPEEITVGSIPTLTFRFEGYTRDDHDPSPYHLLSHTVMTDHEG